MCVARATLQPLLGRTVRDVRGAQDLLSYGGHHLVGPSVVRKAYGYLQGRGRLRDSELAGEEAVYLCDGVVAEQRGGDARGRRRVLVGGGAVRHQRRGDLVGGEHVLVRARPAGQQRARDGGLRLRVLRARRAAVSQQRVYLRGGVVGQQRGRDGVLRRSGAVVSQQRVHL